MASLKAFIDKALDGSLFRMLVEGYGVKKPTADDLAAMIPDVDIDTSMYTNSNDESDFLRMHFKLMSENGYDYMVRSYRLAKDLWSSIPYIIRVCIWIGGFAFLVFFVGPMVMALRHFLDSTVAVAKVALLFCFGVAVIVGRIYLGV